MKAIQRHPDKRHGPVNNPPGGIKNWWTSRLTLPHGRSDACRTPISRPEEVIRGELEDRREFDERG
ncbi:MAG TPA: hypothetical protein VFW95_04495, partial [Candidatus Limnocylindria bacterium]|nr:hypothetical protein [Candidatus Limnocylindria bacterium]